MQAESRSILDAALKLPESERFAIVDQLLESLPDDEVSLSLDDPHLVAELDRRWTDREGAISWDRLQAEE